MLVASSVRSFFRCFTNERDKATEVVVPVIGLFFFFFFFLPYHFFDSEKKRKGDDFRDVSNIRVFNHVVSD